MSQETKKFLLQKLTSRRFWICVAAFLGSLGASWTGNAMNNPTLSAIGMVCATFSAAIYAATEAYVDGSRLKSPKPTEDSGDDVDA